MSLRDDLNLLYELALTQCGGMGDADEQEEHRNEVMSAVVRLREALVGDELEDVRLLHEKFGMHTPLPTAPTLGTAAQRSERTVLVTEEAREFAEALQVGDLPGAADALVDLVYVAKGSVLVHGLERAWPALWADVQRANLAKERGIGPRGHKVDLVKPAGWEPPRTAEILRRFGWDGGAR